MTITWDNMPLWKDLNSVLCGMCTDEEWENIMHAVQTVADRAEQRRVRREQGRKERDA